MNNPDTNVKGKILEVVILTKEGRAISFPNVTLTTLNKELGLLEFTQKGNKTYGNR